MNEYHDRIRESIEAGEEADYQQDCLNLLEEIEKFRQDASLLSIHAESRHKKEIAALQAELDKQKRQEQIRALDYHATSTARIEELEDMNARLIAEKKDEYCQGCALPGRVKELKGALSSLDYVIKTTHLDMGGKHTYVLGGGPERIRQAVGKMKQAIGEKP